LRRYTAACPGTFFLDPQRHLAVAMGNVMMTIVIVKVITISNYLTIHDDHGDYDDDSW
jgi:hypothetical protein